MNKHSAGRILKRDLPEFAMKIRSSAHQYHTYEALVDALERGGLRRGSAQFAAARLRPDLYNESWT